MATLPGMGRLSGYVADLERAIGVLERLWMYRARAVVREGGELGGDELMKSLELGLVAMRIQAGRLRTMDDETVELEAQVLELDQEATRLGARLEAHRRGGGDGTEH